MRYLVTGEFDGRIEASDDVLEAFTRTTELMTQWRGAGIIESYEFFEGELGGCAVFVASDLAELEAMLEQLPIVEHDSFTLDVRPLVEKTDETGRALLDRMGL